MSGKVPPLPGPATRADLLALIGKRFSKEDLRALQATPEGNAGLAMIADIHADESARLDRTITARHLQVRRSDLAPAAQGAVRATAILVITRSRLGFPVVFTRAATRFVGDGHLYQLPIATPMVTWAAGQQGPVSVKVEAVVPGFSSTVVENTINGFDLVSGGASGDTASTFLFANSSQFALARGTGNYFQAAWVGMYIEFTAGANVGIVAQVVGFTTGDGTQIAITANGLVVATGTESWVLRDWGDLGFIVTQPTPCVQGYDDGLDEIGRERARQRQTGETDTALASALLHLSDAISPEAILGAANRAAGIYGPVKLYEIATTTTETDPTLGYQAFPGFVWDLTPWDQPPDQIMPLGPAIAPAAPTGGLAVWGPAGHYFLLRWDNHGIGETGGYWGSDVVLGVPTPDAGPLAWAWDVSPWDGYAPGDAGVRKSIAGAVNKIKGAGVQWDFYPRFFGP